VTAETVARRHGITGVPAAGTSHRWSVPPAGSAAAPGSTQDAWARPDTNPRHPWPLGLRAAVEQAGGHARGATAWHHAW